MVVVKQQVDSRHVEVQSVDALEGQLFDGGVEGIGLAVATTADVGLEAAVGAAAQHRPEHAPPDHPHPQILPGATADVLLQDHSLGAIHIGDELHQITKAAGIAAEQHPLATGAGKQLNHAGETDLAAYQLDVHRKAHKHGAGDGQVALGEDLVGIELILHRLNRAAAIEHRHTEVFELAQDRQGEVVGGAAGAGEEAIGESHLNATAANRTAAAAAHDQINLIGSDRLRPQAKVAGLLPQAHELVGLYGPGGTFLQDPEIHGGLTWALIVKGGGAARRPHPTRGKQHGRHNSWTWLLLRSEAERGVTQPMKPRPLTRSQLEVNWRTIGPN